MINHSFIAEVRRLIAQNDLSKAMAKMHEALKNSDYLDEVLVQNGRFRNIRRSIRLGLISQEEAKLTNNQIHFGLSDLLSELESEGKTVLPQELASNLLTSEVSWTDFLYEEFKEGLGIRVDKNETQIIAEYGWLIAEFLRKLLTTRGNTIQPLRTFSYMTEAWQSSLRYLCCIQIGQMLRSQAGFDNITFTDYLTLRKINISESDPEAQFDYLNLLLDLSDYGRTENTFMPELSKFIGELADTNSDLYTITTFLDNYRRKLLNDQIVEDTSLHSLMDEYLTALIHWLRKISFLARYRLVSIKDIYLHYRIGGQQRFIHLFGELHSFFNEAANKEDYSEKSIQEKFTYNQSVLLFRGRDVEQCLENIGDPNSFISLSPLLIDQSVFAGKLTQTPEIYYFTGGTTDGRLFTFAHFKNELPLHSTTLPSNKILSVQFQNREHPKLNGLHKHLKEIFDPYLD